MNKIFPFVFIFFLACQYNSSENASSHEIDKGLSLANLDNEQITLDSKITILNLWATWCKPCIGEMPALKAMQNQLPKDIKLLVASNEPLERQLKFIAKKNIDLPFVQLKSNLESLGVYALPTTLILNEDGEILETLVGVHEWNSDDQIEKITSYLK